MVSAGCVTVDDPPHDAAAAFVLDHLGEDGSYAKASTLNRSILRFFIAAGLRADVIVEPLEWAGGFKAPLRAGQIEPTPTIV